MLSRASLLMLERVAMHEAAAPSAWQLPKHVCQHLSLMKACVQQRVLVVFLLQLLM